VVRVGDDQRAFGPVDFDRHVLVAGNIEAHSNLDDGTVGKGHHADDMGGYMHGICVLRYAVRWLMIRSLRGVTAKPATCDTGPSRFTRSVM
jgi:hypothetical protein